MHISSEEAARLAGAAFVAAGRAESPEERSTLRAEAERYVELLRAHEQSRIQSLVDRRPE